jgi:hypothetical protein
MEENRSGSRTLRGDVFLLLSLVCAAFLIKLYFLPFFRVISADGAGYANVARAIFRGEGFASSTHFPPLYPLLVGLLNTLVPDVELAGRLVSMIMGSLVVIPIYLLATEFFSRKAGIIASLLAVVWPSLRLWSGEVMSQSTYLTLHILAIYLVWRAFKQGSLLLSTTAGVVMGLSYLTRPEAVIAFAAMTPFLLVIGATEGKSWRRSFAVALAGWGGFLLVSLPYILLLHQVTGKWQLSGKSSATLADALGGYLGMPDLKREPGFQGIGFLDVVRMYPDFLLANLVENLKKAGEEMLPLYLWGLAFLGFFIAGWDRERIVQRLFLLSTFAPLAIIFLFLFTGPEYTQFYLPALFLWAGQGAYRLEGMLLRPFLPETRPQFRKMMHLLPLSVAGAFCLALVILLRQIPGDRNLPYHFSQDGGRYDQKKIGLLLKKYLPDGARIMTRQGRIAFYYSDRGYVDIPQASLPEIIASARQGGARYIVVDGMLAGLRPQMAPLLEPLYQGEERFFFVDAGTNYRPIPGLRLHLLYKDPASLGVAVYEVDGR